MRDDRHGAPVTIAGGYGEALRQIAGFNYPDWALQAVASYTIGTSAAKARLASARIQYEQTQAQIRARELQVATEVTNAALDAVWEAGVRHVDMPLTPVRVWGWLQAARRAAE